VEGSGLGVFADSNESLFWGCGVTLSITDHKHGTL